RRDAPQVGNSAAGQRDETRRLQRPHPVVLRVVLDLGQMQGLQDRRNVHAEPTAQSFLQTVPPADRVFRGPSPGFDRAVHCRLQLAGAMGKSKLFGRSFASPRVSEKWAPWARISLIAFSESPRFTSTPRIASRRTRIVRPRRTPSSAVARTQ